MLDKLNMIVKVNISKVNQVPKYTISDVFYVIYDLRMSHVVC